MEIKGNKRFTDLINTFIIFVWCGGLIACEPMLNTAQQPSSTVTMKPLFTSTPSVTIAQTLVIPSATYSPIPVIIDYIPASEAGDFVGETAIIKIEKAFCSYRPDVNGAPTFCNDQPYPNHTFTLISWGKNWTDLDGRCIFVEGVVEVYKGKLEIIADSRNQVTICD